MALLLVCLSVWYMQVCEQQDPFSLDIYLKQV